MEGKDASLPIVKTLLRYPDRININYVGSNLYGSVLHIAVHTKRMDIVCELLACPNIDLNVVETQHYGTPLTMALSRDTTEAARLFFANHDRLNVNLTQYGGQTALHIAARKGMVKIVRTLCGYPMIDMNMIDKYGYGALHYAVERNHLSIVKELVKDPTKCNVNLRTRTEGLTALHRAIHCPNVDLEIVRVLAAVPTINFGLRDTESSLTIIEFAMLRDERPSTTYIDVLLQHRDLIPQYILDIYGF